MFQEYFNTIQEKYLSGHDNTELTYRSPLETLLSSFEKESIKRQLIIKHETTKQADLGRPDFKVSTKYQLTIGLLETKRIGEDIQKLFNSNQIERYKKISDNIIITDYLRFYFLKKGDPVLNVEFFTESDLKNSKFKISQNKIDELERLFTIFFESEPKTIYKAQDLAIRLSNIAKFLRDFCNKAFTNTAQGNKRLIGIYDAFKETLLPNLDKNEFADIYAQTLSYALFLASLNCDNPKENFDRYSAYKNFPNSFPLIKELFHQLDEYPDNIKWAIDEIISILKITDFNSIKKEFADYRHKEKGFNDPFIYFYEDFLKHYDKSQRELRGAYYTPEPVVSFITHSIENILKNTFGLQKGFMDENVTLLDFATGTGTFLLNAFQLVIDEALKTYDKETVNKILNEQTINNFYGFELLVAPYVIAHLKISEFFKEQGFSIYPDKRLNIFLTNTLTADVPKQIHLLEKLTEEVNATHEVKNKDILVILGNPPYSVRSSNKTGFIADNQMYKYKTAVKLEKNIQPLSDDYVKFIRFAHFKMEHVDKGIVGIITNNSFIDGLIHRGMRHELLKDFDKIYVLNLHGDSKKKEKCPDGSKDENVFDITQGVCISFFIKNKNNKL